MLNAFIAQIPSLCISVALCIALVTSGLLEGYYTCTVVLIDFTPSRQSYVIVSVRLSVSHSVSRMTHECINRCRPNMVGMGKG